MMKIKVISIRDGQNPIAVAGEIQSDIGERLGISNWQEDGTFIDVPIEPMEDQATIEKNKF